MRAHTTVLNCAMRRAPIVFRLPQHTERTLRRAAARCDRPISREIQRYIREGLVRDGYVSDEEHEALDAVLALDDDPTGER